MSGIIPEVSAAVGYKIRGKAAHTDGSCPCEKFQSSTDPRILTKQAYITLSPLRCRDHRETRKWECGDEFATVVERPQKANSFKRMS